MTVLVDTSVWVDFFAGRTAGHTTTLRALLHEGEDIAVCGIILTEVLQGIQRPAEFRRTRELFEALVFLPMQYAAFLRAADIYRGLRRRGITVRKSVDCMIAAVAIENDMPLLHNDRDFRPIEKHHGMKACPRPGAKRAS